MVAIGSKVPSSRAQAEHVVSPLQRELRNVWSYVDAVTLILTIVLYGLTRSFVLLPVVLGAVLASGFIWSLIAYRNEIDRRATEKT